MIAKDIINPDFQIPFSRAIVHIFEGKESDEDRDTVYDVHVSYVEIYNEEIRDLLSDTPTQKLEIKGNNGAIQGKRKNQLFLKSDVSELDLNLSGFRFDYAPRANCWKLR